jgi:xanthine dehydrogenase small subunit
MQKVKISFYLNGSLIEKMLDPEERVLDLLRDILWKTGTKEGCGDGDCGACTITLAQYQNNSIYYQAVNSCLLPIGKLQGTSVVTIEGLGDDNEDLNLIQQAMVDQHGIQCGFCSPGISMNMFALLANKEIPSYNDLLNALNGNICRCTGYDGIKKAAKQILDYLNSNKDYDIVPSSIRECEKELKNLSLSLSSGDYLIPTNKKELLTYLQNCDDSMIVSGCSDVSAIAHTKREKLIKAIDVSRVEEMSNIKLGDDGLYIGGSVSLTSIINSEIVKSKASQLAKGLEEVAAIQVRNLATLSGNIANASPIADGVVLLMAYDATLIIINPNGSREEKLTSFYKGYKKTTLQKGDVIEKIFIENSALEKKYHLEKTGKRNTVDIACVNSCISYKEKENKITDITITFGGIAENVVIEKIKDTDKNENIEILARNISKKYNPLSDVRGSSEYRLKLIENHIIKHFAFILGEL